ncbi:MAG: PQQ-binding-like beta-propeller repeat protein [Bacteroidales bacterium]|nr:PQQ-binding-like beta-propeller repeat protein [Bacteroidales bacterium]
MKNLIYSAFIVLIMGSCISKNEKVYQFRGDDRSGIYQESNLLKEWPEEGLKELWSIETVGNGFCTPIFTEDRFYISGETDGETSMYCFNLAGEMQWQSTIGEEWIKSYPGSRMAPTIVGDLLYTGTGLGNLYCLNIENGEIVWSLNFEKDFAGIPMLHGYSEAPVIDGDKVFWTPGGKEFNAVGLNRFSGEILWSHPGFGERSGYNQGQLIQLPSRNIYVTFSAYHLMGFDTETGELLWSQEQDNLPLEKRTLGMGDTHTNNVIYDNGFIYYSTADGLGGVKLSLSEDGTEIKQVWRNLSFDGLMGGMVKIGDFIYSESFSKPRLLSINANSGVLSDSLKIGSGALLSADNMLYYYSSRGELMLIKFNEGKMEIVSSFKITKGDRHHFAHPVINKSILYLRHGKVLMAFDLKAEG